MEADLPCLHGHRQPAIRIDDDKEVFDLRAWTAGHLKEHVPRLTKAHVLGLADDIRVAASNVDWGVLARHPHGSTWKRVPGRQADGLLQEGEFWVVETENLVHHVGLGLHGQAEHSNELAGLHPEKDLGVFGRHGTALPMGSRLCILL